MPIRLFRLILALFLITPALAADYCVLNNTNMAPALASWVTWRSFIEPETFIITSTNWSMATPPLADTNGMVKYMEVQTIVTNRSIKFTFEGKEFIQPLNQDRGPIVGSREIVVPTPLPPAVLQLRRR